MFVIGESAAFLGFIYARTHQTEERARVSLGA